MSHLRSGRIGLPAHAVGYPVLLLAFQFPLIVEWRTAPVETPSTAGATITWDVYRAPLGALAYGFEFLVAFAGAAGFIHSFFQTDKDTPTTA
jgi:hypothetical protein